MIRNYRDLTQLEMEQVDKKKTVVMIPVGALEQHGNQATLGTDDFIAEAMLEYLKEKLPEDYPMLHDICESLNHHGFKKIAFLVCHGGNAPIIQVLSRENKKQQKSTKNYKKYISVKKFLTI